MYFCTFLASTVALALSVSALPATPGNTRYATLRLYETDNCTIPSLGELGVYGGQLNQCNAFGTFGTGTESVSFEFGIDGCIVRVYSDDACQDNEQDILSVGGCGMGGASYNSYEVLCDI